MEIVGLSGKMRAGKDEAASVLVEEFDFIKVAFADKLREMLFQLNPYVQARGKRKHNDLEYMSLQTVISRYGWNGVKNSAYSADTRRLLQRMGTEAGRETLWDNIWVDAAFAGLDDKSRVVVSDVRFPNEADSIRERGGVIVRIERINILGENPNHISERALDNYNFDLVISNVGSIEGYRNNIRNMAYGWGL